MVLQRPFQCLADYPFASLRGLLSDLSPPADRPTLNLALGEPQGTPPAWLDDVLRGHADHWNRYPPVAGTGAFRRAVAGWLGRRYGIGASTLTPDTMILPAAGTREALFQAAFLAVGLKGEKRRERPVILIPDPFYAVYEGAAVFAGAEPHFLPASAETGYLPALTSVPAQILERTVLCYLCTPSNPTGAVADAAFLRGAIDLARRYDFVLAIDECYSKLFDNTPPPGAASVVTGASDREPWANLLIFNSLSKRSNAAGLRSGFVCGDPALIAPFSKLRSYGGAGTPLPILAAAAALWDDEAHVTANRTVHRQRLDAADACLGGFPGYRRPAGGFFLWLRVGDGERMARRLWTRHGLMVLPGRYLSHRAGGSGVGPGTGAGAGDDTVGRAYIRIALVHDPETTRGACQAIHECISETDRS